MAADEAEAVRPLPFVLVGDDGSFSVNPEAAARLERVKGKLVVVAVAGLYRTGKSFLLNLLVRHAKGIQVGATASSASADDAPGFAVGGTVNACTKGIWMWGEPLELDDGSSLLFLDTEGLGSVDREQTHDTRIFALALLLATNFIYNSRGVIDGNAIEDLSLVVNLSKHIQTSSAKDGGGAGGGGGGADLYQFFPSFMWVVRDFTLQLQDNGKKISAKQYLENALKPQGGYSDDAVAKDQIRALLADFFRERDCVTLVRPVDDEQKLRSLPSVPYDELRDEFRTSFETLRRRVFDKAKPKMLFGKPLNGSMYVNLVGSYVEALNSGKAPVISSAWSRVVQAQCEEALQAAVELYRAEMAARVRPFASPEQFELDADFERTDGPDDDPDQPRDSKGLAVVDHGQGDAAMFDEFGNLRAVPVIKGVSERSLAVVEDEEEDDENAPESEMIEVMEDGEEDEAEVGPERTRLPCAADTLERVHKLSKKLAKHKLKAVVDSDLSDDAREYFDAFRTAVQTAFEAFRQQNAAASMTYCRHVLTKLSQRESRVEDPQKSAMELFRETQTYLSEFLGDLHTEYMTSAVGPSRDAAYCEFVSQQVVGQVIQRTEATNGAHMAEVRALEKQMNDLSVQVAIAQGQASAMQELSTQQREKCELSVREAEQRCASELATLRSTLDFKTNELEHILNHNATMKRLADTAQQGQYRATEFASSAFASVLAGYLIKQHVLPGQAPSRAKWQQRYFVLQGPQLSLFDTKDDYERCRSDNPPMDLTGALIEDNFTVPEAFSISFQDDRYYPLHLHARSADQKREWVESLRRAAGGYRASSAVGYNHMAAPPPPQQGMAYSGGGRYMQM